MNPDWLNTETSVEMEDKKLVRTQKPQASEYSHKESSYSLRELFRRADDVYRRLCATGNFDFKRSVKIEKDGSEDIFYRYEDAEKLLEESGGQIISFNYRHPGRNLEVSMRPEDGRKIVWESGEKTPSIEEVSNHKLSLQISSTTGSRANPELTTYKEDLEKIGFETK